MPNRNSALRCPRLGIPELWFSDGPHGVRMEFTWDDWTHAGWTNDSCTALPALTCLASTFNTELAARYGNTIGEEARFRKRRDARPGSTYTAHLSAEEISNIWEKTHIWHPLWWCLISNRCKPTEWLRALKHFRT